MKKLSSSIYELLGNESASILESNVAKSIELGNKANSFFQFLSRESSYERKISYLSRCEDENTFLSYIVHMCNYFLTIRDSSVEKFGIDYFNFEIKKFLIGTASNYNFSFSDSVEDGILRQGKVFNFGRGHNNYALTEIVYNTLFENGNDPHSVLFIKNLENGTILDLSQLLPKRGMYFFPTIINPLEKAEVKNGKNFVKLKGKPFSLNNYNGALNIKDDKGFAFHSLNVNTIKAEIISYGNIVKKGGLLTLLHEIAHSWSPEKDYKNLINRFVSCLDKRIKQNKPIEKIFEMIDPFLMVDRMVKIEEKAWTDAHHMLLFLRDQGMDLEPEMRINDLDQQINSCLNTYKEFADSFLQFFKH